jgi:hypothetical protein
MNTSEDRDLARPEDGSESAPSRRKLLRNVAAGIATVGAASVVMNAREAQAADGDALRVGGTTEHTSPTNVNYKGETTPASFNVQSGDETAGNNTILTNNFGGVGTAFLGVASGNGNQGIGVIGWSKKPLGTGVIGFTGGAGGYGGEFFGGLAEVRLRPGGAAPITLTNAHQLGELYEDETGTLWICVGAGTPGTWREIAAPSSAGAFHAIAPRRVYDSRTSTKLVPTVDRVVSVANSIDGTLDVVPVKSSAVALTVTVTETQGNGGFVAVRPAGTSYNGTSSINWFGPNQNLATTVISGLDADRQVTLLAGSDLTHIVLDVTGYYR